MKFRESALAHRYLNGLEGLEIGGSAHNPFGLNTRNVDYTDDMTTVFKLAEVEMCGEAMPVDIVAPGDDLPLPDKSVDFVISSHVIEHFWDPIGAILEWKRVARKHIFIICPHRDALESDRDKPLTPLTELMYRNCGTLPAPEVDTHEHYTRWTLGSFVEMVEAMHLRVIETQKRDDKVGNGFTVLIELDQ
jgi:ubiquinone/menaquinone biosynthesis C-methylase UbiE